MRQQFGTTIWDNDLEQRFPWKTTLRQRFATMIWEPIWDNDLEQRFGTTIYENQAQKLTHCAKLV